MSKSLQDQLLGAGLVDKKKAKQIDKNKRKQKNVERRNKDAAPNESQQRIQETQEQKKARDRELNAKIQDKEKQKAIQAQIKQLIELNKIDRSGGEIDYNFVDNKVVKKILITNKISDFLSSGKLCVARLNDSYEIIPKPVADKIRDRDEATIVVYNANTQDSQSQMDSEDEYYAQFEIPDDLMW